MHLLRGIADEIVVSSTALRRIFLVLGLAGLNGGKLDRMKHAMDLAVASRIGIHDLVGPGGENVGVWLNVADVIRQMVMSVNGRPGVDYNIVLTGDGRLVTGGRTTTFLGLRIVYMDGHNSLASDAIWPIAIIERPEKRGPFRLYTQALRLQLAHVQKSGLLLPTEYTEAFDPPASPAAAAAASPVSESPAVVAVPASPSSSASPAAPSPAAAAAASPVSESPAVRAVPASPSSPASPAAPSPVAAPRAIAAGPSASSFQERVLPDEAIDKSAVQKFFRMAQLERARRKVWHDRRLKRRRRRTRAG
jgi:hypothetical protein